MIHGVERSFEKAAQAEYCTVVVLNFQNLTQVRAKENLRSYMRSFFRVLRAARLRNDRLPATVSPSCLIVLDSLLDHLVHEGTEIHGIGSPSLKVISTSIQS